jgi:pimeloyl-ACP methyl ester carboxylesterase
MHTTVSFAAKNCDVQKKLFGLHPGTGVLYLMRKYLLHIASLLLICVLAPKCVILQKRWSDQKACRRFHANNTPLEIHDTVIDNRHLHFAVTGSDSLPVLVLIHGSPGSWKQFAKFMYDTALHRKFKIVSIDRPGFGHSDFGKALHLQEQCKIILPVLQSLKSTKPMFLFGHSMGAPVAVQLAASDPRLFSGLVIASGAIDVKQERKEIWRRIMAIKPLYWALPGAFGPSNTELLYLKKDLVPLQEEFKKIKTKVYFIHGSKDHWVPIQNVAYGREMLVNAESISIDTIPGAGHLIIWRNKPELCRVLMNLY